MQAPPYRSPPRGSHVHQLAASTCLRAPACHAASAGSAARASSLCPAPPAAARCVGTSSRAPPVFATLDQHAVYTVLPVRRGAWSAMRAAIRQRRHPRPCLYRGSVQCDTVVRGSSHGSSRFVTPLKVFKNLTTVVRFSFLLRQAFFSGYSSMGTTRRDWMYFAHPGSGERGGPAPCGRACAHAHSPP
jgi:hypothetical protein